MTLDVPGDEEKGLRGCNISILATVGRSPAGVVVGDEIEWPLPAGARSGSGSKDVLYQRKGPGSSRGRQGRLRFRCGGRKKFRPGS
jgi:hypothetical protein